MLIKTTAQTAFQSDVPSCLVKVATSGVGPADLKALQHRMATKLSHAVRNAKSLLRPGESLIHLLAIGATESYGPNRNGDGFRSSVCQAFHPTFEKFARFYRNHKNDDPTQSYGRIVESGWNDAMQRIELLVALNGTKEAADRNGGLIADIELERLATGRDIPVSMACKIAYDVCSYCGNKAETLDKYCKGLNEGGFCKAGGLRSHIGDMVTLPGSDLHHLHADNPEPYFFDISYVPKPADRIAYVTGLLEKAASGHTVKSACLARELGVSLPLSLLQQGAASGRYGLFAMAQKMARAEQQFRTTDARVKAAALAFKCPVLPMTITPPHKDLTKFAAAFGAMAQVGNCLSPSRFVELTTGMSYVDSVKTAAAFAPYLPGVFGRILHSDDLTDRLNNCTYTHNMHGIPESYQKWATCFADELSLLPTNIHRRVVRSSLTDQNAMFRDLTVATKLASEATTQEQLAREYATYQLCFLDALDPSQFDLPLTQSMVLAQNHVI